MLGIVQIICRWFLVFSALVLKNITISTFWFSFCMFLTIILRKENIRQNVFIGIYM